MLTLFELGEKFALKVEAQSAIPKLNNGPGLAKQMIINNYPKTPTTIEQNKSASMQNLVNYLSLIGAKNNDLQIPSLKLLSDGVKNNNRSISSLANKLFEVRPQIEYLIKLFDIIKPLYDEAFKDEL